MKDSDVFAVTILDEVGGDEENELKADWDDIGLALLCDQQLWQATTLAYSASGVVTHPFSAAYMLLPATRTSEQIWKWWMMF